jgi:hypothetical protein
VQGTGRAAAFTISAFAHVLVAVATSTSAKALQTAHRDRAIAVFVTTPENAQYPGLRPFDSPQRETSYTGGGPDHLLLPGLQIDLQKIAGRIHVLFPVLAPGLAIDSFFPDADMLIAPAQAVESGNRPRQDAAPTLILTERATHVIVDRSWARRDRWHAFQPIVTLMNGHAAGGTLPRLLRAYRVDDGLQPYEDGETRDPRLWVQLTLAADHVRFIGFIRTYVASHPSSPAATELLFLLDTIVQGEQDVLHVLLDTDPSIDLQLTRESSTEAYALIARIRNEYQRELKARGLVSRKAIDAYYENVRLTILRRVIATARDAYGIDDARFLMGTICWRAGRRSEALSAWRALSARSDGSYAAVSAALRLAVAKDQVDDREITHILKNEDGRWLSASYDRLRHFGYRMDTY